MGIFTWGIPTWLLDAVRASGRYDLAVESGTFHGDSALALANAVDRCITIELGTTLATAATARFAGDPRITVLQGSSRDLLPGVVGDLTGPTVFWLDGHWSGGTTAGAHDPCPLDGELDAIAGSPLASDCLVAIDDARLFGLPRRNHPGGRAYPDMLEVLTRLDAMGLHPYVVDDVILGVPAADEEVISTPEVYAALGQNTSMVLGRHELALRRRGRRLRSRLASILPRRR